MTTPGYLCPYCAAHLDAGNNIVLTAKTTLGKKGVVLLGIELGDYTVTYNPSLEFKQGECVDLSCSVCHHSLIYNEAKNLCKLIRITPKREEQTVLFSRVFGEQCTLHIEGKKVTSYGEHALRYQDPEWYLQVDE